MKVISAIVLSAVMVASLGLAPAFAQLSEYVTVETDMQSYNEGDVIIVTGHVAQKHTGGITIQVLSPSNNLVAVGQPTIGPDNMFTFMLSTGDIMKEEGMYTVKATYSLHANSPRVGQTMFMYTPIDTPGIIVDGTDFEPQYDISGGIVTSMHTNPQSNSLIISLDAMSDGQITITLPRELIDFKSTDGTDEQFFTLVDGEEVWYTDVSSDADSRTITIEFMVGSSQIEIIGSSVAVPEFGTIAALILAVAITSIIVMSARSRLSLMPKL